MTFISYAQNFEDVMLWRALKDITKGTYVDVGAADPSDDSVTKLFYDNGWSGINVDPIEQWHQKLSRERKRDINLKVAISNVPGEIAIYDIPNTGLSTSVKEFSDKHETLHGYKAEEIIVPTKSLDEIIQEHELRVIHFLKIDVEGAEKSVLKSINLKVIRPWIVVVESTEPNSQVSTHDDWEYILLSADYLLAYCDGLNRFYVASEHSELLERLIYPPNVFDNFISSVEARLQKILKDVTSKLDSTYTESLSLKSKLESVQKESIALKSELQGVYSSYSWRITSPLRRLKQAFAKRTG
jgi:FkbM family methyltransferase